MKTILFLCTGNVCRSPMAEGLFRRAVKGRGDSAFIRRTWRDRWPAADAAFVTAMRELGIDISNQRSRALTTDLCGRRILFSA